MSQNKEVKDKKEQQEAIVKQIMAIAKSINYKFTLRNEPITVEKAFSTVGLLPAIMRRADQLCYFCMGYGLGVTFEKAENSMLGVSVYFDKKVAISLRLLCVVDVLLEIVHSSSSNQSVPLDSLLEE
jgi:intracellular multiplication protein IcmS